MTMQKTFSVYYKSKPDMQLLGDSYHSKSGSSSVAKKAMTKLFKKTGQKKATLYIREHGTNTFKVYQASSAKLPCPVPIDKNGTLIFVTRRSKSRYSKTIKM